MTRTIELQVDDRAPIETAETTQMERVLDEADLAAIGGGTGNVHDAVVGTVIKWGLMNLGYSMLTHNGRTILIAP